MGMATPPFDDILAGVKTAAKNWFFTAPHEIGYSFIFSYGFALDEPIPRKPELSINDDERLKTALKWLVKAFDSQIIIFTCHKREAAFLSRLGVQYHLVPLS